MSKAKEIEKSNTDNKRNYIIGIGGIIVFIVSALIIFFSEPSLIMSKYRNLPEAKVPQTGNNMQKVDYLPRELAKNDAFTFSKATVFKLKRDLRGYFVDHSKDFVNGYFKILTMNKMLYSIEKDVPELSSKAKEYRQKIDSIYGPAIIQYLYCMYEFGHLKDYDPEKIFQKNINSQKEKFENTYQDNLKNYNKYKVSLDETVSNLQRKLASYNNIWFVKNFLPNDLINEHIGYYNVISKGIYVSEKAKSNEKLTNYKQRYPFLYNEKYTNSNALKIFKEAEVMTGKTGTYKELIHLLLFHPKALSCDAQYILSNLCYGRTLTQKANGHFYNWSFSIPKYWDLVPNPNKSTDLIFYTKLDSISGGITFFDKSEDTNTDSDQSQIEYLKSFSEKIDLIKKFIQLSIFNTFRTNIVKIGDKNVLLVEYAGQKPNNTYLQGRVYLFLTKYNVFAYMFNIESIHPNDCSQKMDINIPLFDGIVSASKVTY